MIIAFDMSPSPTLNLPLIDVGKEWDRALTDSRPKLTPYSSKGGGVWPGADSGPCYISHSPRNNKIVSALVL